MVILAICVYLYVCYGSKRQCLGDLCKRGGFVISSVNQDILLCQVLSRILNLRTEHPRETEKLGESDCIQRGSFSSLQFMMVKDAADDA